VSSDVIVEFSPSSTHTVCFPSETDLQGAWLSVVSETK
jgi:hypothetical protein